MLYLWLSFTWCVASRKSNFVLMVAAVVETICWWAFRIALFLLVVDYVVAVIVQIVQLLLFSNWSTCAGLSTYCDIYVVIELFYWALWILCCLSVAVDFCGLAVINCNVHFVIGDTVFPFKVVWELCWWSWHGVPYYLC